MRLTTANHDRDAAKKRYLYAVLSRRSGGVSVGVNLNVNNACNYRCIYCQVPGLIAGKAPQVDLALLEKELASLLDDIESGDFLKQRVDQAAASLKDVALSGNGEPTSSPQIGEVISLVGEALSSRGLLGKVPIVVISNGSLMLKPAVGSAMRRLHELGGQIWFKMDSVTAEGILQINNSALGPEEQLARLLRASELCRTQIQTCMFALDGEPPSSAETDAYLARIEALVAGKHAIEKVLLYGLARPSHQPEAGRLSPLPESWLEAFAEKIRSRGMDVNVSL